MKDYKTAGTTKSKRLEQAELISYYLVMTMSWIYVGCLIVNVIRGPY